MKYNNNGLLLAVDIDVCGGFAMYRGDGTLWRYGTTPSVCLKALRRSAKDIVTSCTSIDWLISAGDVQRTVVWERLAFRCGIRVQRLRTSDWSPALLAASGDAANKRWQHAVLLLAEQIIRDSKAIVAPERLSLEMGKAILIGFWAVRHLGLIKNPQVRKESRSLTRETVVVRKPIALVG